MEGVQEPHKDSADKSSSPPNTQAPAEVDLLEVVIRKIAIRNVRKTEGVKCVIKCGNFEQTTRAFRRSKADSNCLLCIELINLTATSIFNEVSLEAWKYTQKYPDGKAIGGIKITVSELVSENWLTLMGYSKLMKRDTFKGNMFLFASPKDQEKYTRIMMQNIRSRQIHVQGEYQGGMPHNLPTYSQGVLSSTETHQMNNTHSQSHSSQHGKEDRFDSRQIIVVQNDNEARSAYYLSSSGHSVVKHSTSDDEGDEDDDEDDMDGSMMSAFPSRIGAFGVLDRMSELRESMDDGMDEQTAMIVQHAVNIIDKNVDSIRKLLSSAPYSAKLIQDLKNHHREAQNTVSALKKMVETIPNSDMELKFQVNQIYQTKLSDVEGAHIAIDIYQKQQEPSTQPPPVA